MLETSARLLRLLTMLQGQRTWSGTDLATRLEVTARTLRRDVERLRTLGYPIASTSGTAGGYTLGRGTFLPPLMFDDQESVGVAIALQIAAGTTVAGIENASQRALAKLERVLPVRLQRRLKALRSALLRMADSGPPVEMGMVAGLATACSEGRGVRFFYRDHDGVETERCVEPHRVVDTGRRWYVVAWDTARRDWRTFRLDRIRAPLTALSYFVQRASPDDDLVAYVTRSVSSGPYRHAVQVVLRAPIDTMRARISSSEGLLVPIDDASCRLSLGTNSLETTAAWLARLNADFEIEAPADLVKCVRRLAARFRRASHASHRGQSRRRRGNHAQ